MVGRRQRAASSPLVLAADIVGADHLRAWLEGPQPAKAAAATHQALAAQVPMLVQRLGDEDAVTHAAATVPLALAGSKDSRAALNEALDDADEVVRASVVLAVGAFDDDASSSALAKASSDEAALVCGAAVVARLRQETQSKRDGGAVSINGHENRVVEQSFDLHPQGKVIERSDLGGTLGRRFSIWTAGLQGLSLSPGNVDFGVSLSAYVAATSVRLSTTGFRAIASNPDESLQ